MKVLIPITHGSESLETITLVNLLRRALIEVDLCSVESDRLIEATRGIRLHADSLLSDRVGEIFDAIVLPGGEPGARRLAKCAPLATLLTAQRLAHRWYGAICAAPALTLSPLGLLDGKQATCYPSLREHLLHYVDLPVVIDGHCITSQGPGTAQAFALTWIEKLSGVEARRQVAESALIVSAQ